MKWRRSTKTQTPSLTTLAREAIALAKAVIYGDDGLGLARNTWGEHIELTLLPGKRMLDVPLGGAG